MKNKGFTLVELLAVVAILAIVAGLSMAVFTRVRDDVLNQELNNIASYIEAQAQNYAADTNITVINVEGLIQAGYVEPDDETDIYNPVTNESLNCFVVRTSYEEGEYTSVLDLDSSNNLMDENGICNFYEQIGDDLILIGVEQSNGTYRPANNSEWYGTSVNLAIINQENNEPFTAGSEISYLWQSNYGTTQTSSTITADVAEGVASNIPYTAIINYHDEDGNNVSRTASALINIDKENPRIFPVENPDNETWAQYKNVTISATDSEGSGLYGIYVQSTTENGANITCPTSRNRYNDESISGGNNGVYTYEARAEGWYQACAMDNVGNVSVASNKFQVDNVDGTIGNATISASPTAPTNQSVTLTGNGEDEDSGIVAYKFNQTGNVNDGTWNTIPGNPVANTTQTQPVTQNGTYYFCIQDAIGNEGCSDPVTVNNIDRTPPTVDLDVNTTAFTYSVILTGSAEDASGIAGYQLTESSSVPSSWITNPNGTTNNLSDIDFTRNENTTYYFWVRDRAGNTSYARLNVNNIVVLRRASKTISDRTRPVDGYVSTSGIVQIVSVSTSNGYVSSYSMGSNRVNVTATGGTSSTGYEDGICSSNSYLNSYRADEEEVCASRYYCPLGGRLSGGTCTHLAGDSRYTTYHSATADYPAGYRYNQYYYVISGVKESIACNCNNGRYQDCGSPGGSTYCDREGYYRDPDNSIRDIDYYYVPDTPENGESCSGYYSGTHQAYGRCWWEGDYDPYCYGDDYETEYSCGWGETLVGSRCYSCDEGYFNEDTMSCDYSCQKPYTYYSYPITVEYYVRK